MRSNLTLKTWEQISCASFFFVKRKCILEYECFCWVVNSKVFYEITSIAFTNNDFNSFNSVVSGQQHIGVL